ncbi:MAG: nucleoside triphosphate pyrophosphohydrolase [Melioribacteraceae bacterium]|nr:nucleoside triphosphate pyrophosphohydrolase [Melioribacteraceae bacterium]MCF8266353.1 nucleoside triphosphate pyrophosphohydrolase [Melioribacteraceae bacterium]MCF8431948.1 nucleoside triphosphate pyrophosphohydrolase [Melioribacteraceae bacterium]
MPKEKFAELIEIMNRLRVECPWDREQTNDSIKDATLEEAYEVIEAIDDKDFDELKKELGDLLLHVVFHSKIAEDEGHFSIEDVISGITEKLIRRHPHVFGDTVVNGNKDIEMNWEKIKLQEGRTSVVEGVPKNLPGLNRAFRLQQKAAKVGFDWENKEDVWKKVKEELDEIEELSHDENNPNLEAEIGDLLFSIANYCRFVKVSPESALRLTNEKFIKRFTYIEDRLREKGKAITDSNLEEMDKYWEESKSKV